MSSDLITMSVNGMELWNTLNLKEGLCYSPKFQLALRTSESEVEILQERYKDAIDLFQRAQRVNTKQHLQIVYIYCPYLLSIFLLF